MDPIEVNIKRITPVTSNKLERIVLPPCVLQSFNARNILNDFYIKNSHIFGVCL